MTAMHAASGQLSTIRDGIRPFDIARDLRPVAELIADAFSNELDQRGNAALREMRVMSYVGGFLKLLNRATGEFDDVFSGFVWVEDNTVVGNITVQRAGQSGSRWQIANVAVDPAYRRQGIGQQLMQHALTHIQESGGRWAVLQVYENNRAARHLYARLGFEDLGGRADLRLKNLPTLDMPAPIANFRPFAPAQWPELYNLASSQISAQSQWWRPLRRSDFQVSFDQQMGEWLWHFLGRQRILRRSIQISQRFEAAVVLTASRWHSPHRLQLWVRPERYGQYEAGLIQWVLATLADYPRAPVEANLSTEHRAALHVLQEVGFQVEKTLVTMRRRMAE